VAYLVSEHTAGTRPGSASASWAEVRSPDTGRICLHLLHGAGGPSRQVLLVGMAAPGSMCTPMAGRAPSAGQDLAAGRCVQGAPGVREMTGLAGTLPAPWPFPDLRPFCHFFRLCAGFGHLRSTGGVWHRSLGIVAFWPQRRRHALVKRRMTGEISRSHSNGTDVLPGRGKGVIMGMGFTHGPAWYAVRAGVAGVLALGTAGLVGPPRVFRTAELSLFHAASC
jgi:hypothetical protein